MYGLRRVACLLFATALLLAAQSASAIVTVGPSGSGCTYTKIQDAINYVLGKERNAPNDVDPYIAVAGDNVYNEALVIDGSNVTNYTDPFGQAGAFVQIYGNYDQHCDDIPNGSTAKIGAGGGKFGNSVLEIRGSKSVHVILNHFILTDAGGVVTGGGINFHGTGYLDLYNVDITGNFASYGGGIYTDGHAPGLTLVLHPGTTIDNNTAGTNGGGISNWGETFLYATEGNVVVSGNTSSGPGGGMAFNGHGSVTFGGVQVSGNRGTSGGGIYVNADSPTDVNFYDSVYVGVNTADQAGGGMTIAGQAKLYAQSSAFPTQIFVNTVLSDSGPGGGVYVAGPAEMRFTGAIFSNIAGYGGGVAALAGSDLLMDAYVALTPAGPTSPVSVSNNSATHTGGGIYVRGNSTFSTSGDNYIYGTVCASDFVIDGNSAVEGTAIYADQGDDSVLALPVGSTVALNFDGPVTGRLGCPHPPFQCAAGVACNEVNGNFRSGGGSGDGSTILVQEDSELDARNVKLQKNAGAHALRSVGDQWGMDMGTMLITDNQVDGELIYFDSATLKIVDSTIANNTMGSQNVIRASGHIDLVNSIVAEATPYTINFAGNNNLADRNIDFVLTNRSDPTLGSSGYVLYDTPSFVDVANRDYHLRPYSPGLDVAPAVSNSPPDLDRRARDVDLPQIVNMQGPRDLGAYELKSIPRCSAPDQLFCNGFGAAGGQ